MRHDAMLLLIVANEPVMLSVIRPSVVTLSVVRLSVVSPMLKESLAIATPDVNKHDVIQGAG